MEYCRIERVIERVECSVLRWFGYIERMLESEITKESVYEYGRYGGAGGTSASIHLRGKWRLRGLEHAQREYMETSVVNKLG